MKRVILARPLRSATPYVRTAKKEEVVGNTHPTPPPPSPHRGRGGGGGITRAASHVDTENQSVDDLLASIQHLPANQRKELLAKLSLNAQTLPSGEARDVDMWAGALYEAIVAANGGDGGGLGGPAQIKRLVAVPSAWANVANFMESSHLDQLTVTERQSVYGMLASLVVTNARYVARKSRIPLTGKLVANCATNVAGIFAQSFPGYLESGLALLVAKRWTSQKVT
jgi:hypothetical protein